MHPFLIHRRWLVSYLLVWALLATVPATVLAPGGAQQWAQAFAVVLAPTVLFAVSTLPCWYLCRALRPEWSAAGRLVAAHGIAAVVWSVLWLALGQIMAQVVGAVTGGLDAPREFESRRAEMFAVGILFYALAAAFHYLLMSLETAREAQSRISELEIQARDSALTALKAQIHPHFLFNSLNTISALTTKDPAQARQMCILLADFLRMSLRTAQKQEVSWADELALTKAYLGVEAIRLGARLQIIEDIDPDCRSFLVPPLILQPLVENAIRHGIALLAQGGRLKIAARIHADTLRLQVTNPYDPEAKATSTSGLGLRTLRERLRTMYEDRAMIEISRASGVFDVVIRLPVHPA